MNRVIKFRLWDGHEMLQNQEINGNWLLCGNYGSSKVMQFTGLLDKNGKEIYEGDIVRAEGQTHRYIQVVEFHNSEKTCGRGWVGVNKIKEECAILRTPRIAIESFSYFCWPASWEIIGNIYEHPHLLTNPK